MKILQINAVYGIGSTGFYTKKMHEMLTQNGEDSYVICSKADIDADTSFPENDKINKNIIQVSSTFEKKLNALYARVGGIQGYGARKATDKIIGIIKKINPDVIHIGNLHANFVNIKRLLKFIADNDIPLVVTLHDCWFFTGKCVYYSDVNCLKWQDGCGKCPKLKTDIPSWYFDKTSKMLAEKAALFDKIKNLTVVGVSERITDDARNSIVFSGKHCICIPNAIDDSIFFARSSHIEKNTATIFGAASGWSSFKGIDDFIYLAKALKQKYSKPFEIILAGDCDKFSFEQNREIEKCGIKMVGYKTSAEMANLYRSADVFVSASKAESFGCVLAEAVMCGTPVVAYDGYAEREILSQEECGECVPFEDREQLLTAVINVLTKGRDYYCESLAKCSIIFSLSEYYDRYYSIYEKT